MASTKYGVRWAPELHALGAPASLSAMGSEKVTSAGMPVLPGRFMGRRGSSDDSRVGQAVFMLRQKGRTSGTRPSAAPGGPETRGKNGARGLAEGDCQSKPRRREALRSASRRHGRFLVRLFGFWIALPAFQLDLEGLDRHRIGVGVEIGHGREFADPAIVQEVTLSHVTFLV